MRKIIIIFVVFMLNANYAFAGMIVGDTANGCNNSTDLYAVFEPNQYDCAPGEYLPANHDGCEPCLSGATCVGGTFTFNKYFAKGLVYTNNVATDAGYGCQSFDAQMTAVFERNQYTCSAGEYLPANTDGCQTCPEDHYCAGGTYTFNETTNQGVSDCPHSEFSENLPLYSPAGSKTRDDCTHRFWLNDKYMYMSRTKTTYPSLVLTLHNKDRTIQSRYHIHMTKKKVPMSAQYKNLNRLNHYVITLRDSFIDGWGNTIEAGKYYAYDDTIDPDVDEEQENNNE